MKYYAQVGGTFTHVRVDQTPHKRTKLVGDHIRTERIEQSLLITTTLMDSTSQAYSNNLQHRRT